ncbi:MAG: M15 family metallopeptidase [Tannerella sp.]|jgi:D-alanyl-D-alanine dipeptidase|nr:M15 family metallopeptidase [Tannerella sp.]
MKVLRIFVVLSLCLFTFCVNAQKRKSNEFDWDAKMKELGLMDVCFWEPSIQSYLVYATNDNFTEKPLYNMKLTKAWLHPRATRMLIRAQDLLQEERPDLSLLVLDAARPMEVQREMGKWAKLTNNEYYIANPGKGGLHNYGLAVDVTLVGSDGIWLQMGTPFDYFGPEANTDKEDELLRKRLITATELTNRRLLRRIMEKAGFTSVSSEWWHFNACRREEAAAKYILIDRD